MPPVVHVEPLTTARALRGPFDYLRPDGVEIGSLLIVPFGRRDVTGVVTGTAAETEVPAEKLVAPRRVLDERVPPELVELAAWVGREYCSTFARALQLVLPPAGARERTQLWAERTADGEAALIAASDTGMPGGGALRLTGRQLGLLRSLPRFAGDELGALRRLEVRGLVTVGAKARRRAPVHAVVGAAKAAAPPLTPEQRVAIDAIVSAPAGERILLHGVTGSGKTEVYLGAVAAVLERGQSAIVLVPEIALTPQTVSRFVERFGDTVAVLHSRLGRGERYDEWQRLSRGEARVCVGPRSAVFAPVRDLGLIVIDEEHDPSYKHEGDPRYDARLVAERRTRRTSSSGTGGAVLVAGSATPRAESAHALRRLRLPHRVDGAALPPVEVLDMLDAAGPLHPDTTEALHASGKTIVLLNRRGWSNFLTCRSCGHVWECPQCDVSLVLHRAEGALACHHCGHRERVPTACAQCGSVSVARHGAGTERLEAELAAAGLPVWRLDADVSRPGDVLRAFARAPSGVLVGTQVVAKGHDFPDVTLGVVLDADATLRFPDFRAEERTFALVAQLAGRAGRGRAGGKVLVQTMAPDAEAIRFAADHDADGFLAGELARREALRYPPFASLIRVVCSSEAPGAALAAAEGVRERLGFGPPAVLGPAPLFRLRGRERAQLLVKALRDRAKAVAAVGAAVDATAADRRFRDASFSVDVDPQ